MNSLKQHKINKYLQIVSLVLLQGGTAENIIWRSIYWGFWLPLFLWTWKTQCCNWIFNILNLARAKAGSRKSDKSDQNCSNRWDIPQGFFLFFCSFCRHAISSLFWDQTRKHFGENSSVFFSSFLAGPAPFSYVSIAKDRAKPHRVKKQFPTSWQLYKCMVANVGRRKGGRWVQIRGWKTPWWQWRSREVNPAV